VPSTSTAERNPLPLSWLAVFLATTLSVWRCPWGVAHTEPNLTDPDPGLGLPPGWQQLPLSHEPPSFMLMWSSGSVSRQKVRSGRRGKSQGPGLGAREEGTEWGGEG